MTNGKISVMIKYAHDKIENEVSRVEYISRHFEIITLFDILLRNYFILFVFDKRKKSYRKFCLTFWYFFRSFSQIIIEENNKIYWIFSIFYFCFVIFAFFLLTILFRLYASAAGKRLNFIQLVLSIHNRKAEEKNK